MGKSEIIHDPMKTHTTESEIRLWRAFKKRHGITSSLTPTHITHWVKRKARKTFSDEVAMAAYWQGHKPEGGMEAHCGTNLPEGEILEEQSREWPDGPLGDLLPVRVSEGDVLPPQVANAVLAYLRGEKGELELALELGKFRQKTSPNDFVIT